MSRVLAILLSVAAVIVAVVVLTSSSGGEERDAGMTYRVELDNASGLTEGADFRTAGVQVGSIEKLDIDVKTARAIAVVSVDRPEFGGLRKDAECTIKPQSLIGEYFMDCEPGVSPEQLGPNGIVGIARTSGTVPPDLVMNVLRKPYREKLQVILAELGAGFAARGGDVDETIRRAIPALRETDGVLRILSDERQTLAQLTRDADTVVGRLDGNRTDVARFVSEARDTAAISTRRKAELAGTIRRLPRFQRVLRPTLQDLGTAARRQTPALRDLRAAAPSLTTLLDRLGPFAEASVPAVQSLGRASVTGTAAVKDARPFVRRLRTVAGSAKEPLTNLRFVLEHLDDRKNAVEPNPMSPGGTGFTGLEAVMQYFYQQSQAINLYDDKGYVLKLNALVNECSAYTNGSTALDNPERTKRCSAALGPGGKIERTPTAAQARAQKQAAATNTPDAPAESTPAPVPAPTPDVASPAPGADTTPQVKPAPAVPLLPDVKLPEVKIPGVEPGASADLLDFLLGQ